MQNIINITFGTLMTTMDDEVVRAVQKVGIDVNKEELLKALELYHHLVRCKDCKYIGKAGDVSVCRIHEISTRADDYCSRGERRDNERYNIDAE